MIIVNVEEKRKDYIVMSTHHVITILLIMGSYYTHVTPVGNAILCCMDFADILLSTAKVFNYMKWQRTTDTCFIVFLVSWIVTRHGFFNILTYSVYNDMPRFNTIQWDPSRQYFHTYGIYTSYIVLLSGLEILCIYWFYLVVGIVRRVISGRKPEDTRSDSEDSGDEDASKQKKKQQQKKAGKKQQAVDAAHHKALPVHKL
ncbi:TLC domain-containing protein [Syncephalis fuscata]|nr:TLC domain-containing protein [Syncephalis fuscata]